MKVLIIYVLPEQLLGICRVGQNHIYAVYVQYVWQKKPNIRSYTVYMHGSGQPWVQADKSMINIMMIVSRRSLARRPLIVRSFTAFVGSFSQRYLLIVCVWVFHVRSFTAIVGYFGQRYSSCMCV
jgi:hypothetical protein